MTAISRATNTVPIARVEWLAIAFIASQTIGNVAVDEHREKGGYRRCRLFCRFYGDGSVHHE